MDITGQNYTHTLTSSSVNDEGLRTTVRQPVTVTEDGIYAPMGNLLARTLEDLRAEPSFKAIEQGASTPAGATLAVNQEALFEAYQALVAVPYYLDGDSPIKAYSFAQAAISQLQAALGIEVATSVED